MTIALPESAPNTGELLDGRYLLDSRIGVGGMGVVYRARDETLGRTVAVKVFRDQAAEAARTSSETRLLAGLNHSALVTLFDARVEEGHPSYLVMEYIDGPTLRDRISEGPIASGEVAIMARDLAEALHVVHDAGIVHRDIKPSNVLLRRSHVPGEKYRAKLADFGIAHLVDSTRLTTPGTLIGTAAYLSPEQVRGATPAVAADIYALGLVLLEALTGERAFPQVTTHETALARLTRDPVIPGAFGYGWKSLLSAMTSRDPELRPTAIDIVIAASHLSEGAAADPTVTGAIILDQPTMAIPAHVERTSTAATLPDPGARSTDAVDPSTQGELESDATPAGRRGQRWHLIAAVAGIILIIIVVGVCLWALGTSSDHPEPSLPTLTEPLGTHMRQLLDAVQP